MITTGKKIWSFIVIFIILAMLFFVVISQNVVLREEADVTESFIRSTAVSVDNNAFIARVIRDKNYIESYSLNSHNQIISNTLESMEDAEEFYIENIFVSANNVVFVAGYELDEEKSNATQAIVQVYDINGKFIKELVRVELQNQDILDIQISNVFSSFKEQNTEVAFGVRQGMDVTTYVVHDSANLDIKTTFNYKLDSSIRSFAVTNWGKLVVALNRDVVDENGNIRVYYPNDTSASKEEDFNNFTSMSPAKIWIENAQQLLIFDIALDGFMSVKQSMVGYNAYGDSADTDIYILADDTVDQNQQIKFGELDTINVTLANAMSAIYTKDNKEYIFVKTNNNESLIPVEKNESFPSTKEIVWISLICLGITLVIWVIYIYAIKARMSIILREIITVGVTISVMMSVLVTFVIVPKMSDNIFSMYDKQLDIMSSLVYSMLSEDDLIVAFEKSETYEEYNQKSIEVKNKLEQATDLVNKDGNDKISLNIYIEQDGVVMLSFSSDYPSVALNTNRIPRGEHVSECVIRASAGETVQLTSKGILKETLYNFREIEDGIVLCVSSDIAFDSIKAEILYTGINQFCITAGLIIASVFLVIQILTAMSILKLKGGVDKVAAGDYSIRTHIRTGDEVEGLSNSINALTATTDSTIKTLENLNRVYAKFFPRDLISVLGGGLENLDKNCSVKKVMNVMFVSFSFVGAPKNISSEELFRNINDVMENIAGTVSINNGSIFSFDYYGFSAVFDRDAEDAVRAALQIRNIAASMNDRGSGENLNVDLRVVISRGEVMLGVIGDTERMAPVAVSDSLEHAREIMQLCVPSGIYVCCTGDIVERVQGYRNRYVGLYNKGSLGIRIYDLFDSDPVTELKHKETSMDTFNAGVEAFYSSDFQTARTLFMEIVKRWQKDKTAVNYMYYAEQYLHGEIPKLCYRVFDDRR